MWSSATLRDPLSSFGLVVVLLASVSTYGMTQVPLSDTTLLEVPHSFFRYDTPGECLHDVDWVEGQFWRARRRDTLFIPRTGDRLQPVTIEQLLACLARFQIENVSGQDVFGLGRAYLAAGKLVQADSALRSFERTAIARPDRAWLLYQIVTAYLDAPEPRLVQAALYLAQLDALGAHAAPERLLAHLTMIRQARVRDSVALQEREVHAALVASRVLTGDAAKEYVSASAMVYIELAHLKARQNDGVGARAALDTGRHTVAAILPGAERLIDLYAGWFQLLGTTAPPIAATLWANTGPDGEQRPVRGRPSLVVFWGGGSFPGLGVLRRLSQRYASRGLDITLVHRSAGYYRNQLVPADTELVRWRDLFLNELRLPVTVALWKTDLGRRDDGRVTVLSAPNDDAYRPPQSPLVTYVIDARGTIRLVTALSHDNEAILDDVLGTLF